MDDSFQDLEAELKRLRPRTPSAGLLSRLERELAGPDAATDTRPSRERRSTPVGTLRWVVWPAAAALVVLGGIAGAALLPPAPPLPVPPPEPLLPGPLLLEHAASDISPIASTPLKTVRAETIASSGKRLLSRTVGQSFFETDGHSRTQASVQWIVPRAEVRVVPVEAF